MKTLKDKPKEKVLESKCPSKRDCNVKKYWDGVELITQCETCSKIFDIQ